MGLIVFIGKSGFADINKLNTIPTARESYRELSGTLQSLDLQRSLHFPSAVTYTIYMYTVLRVFFFNSVNLVVRRKTTSRNVSQ